MLRTAARASLSARPPRALLSWEKWYKSAFSFVNYFPGSRKLDTTLLASQKRQWELFTRFCLHHTATVVGLWRFDGPRKPLLWEPHEAQVSVLSIPAPKQGATAQAPHPYWSTVRLHCSNATMKPTIPSHLQQSSIQEQQMDSEFLKIILRTFSYTSQFSKHKLYLAFVFPIKDDTIQSKGG